MMTPADLGLDPIRFPSFRRAVTPGLPSQIDHAVNIATSERRYQLLNAMTGGGKSLIYTAAALLLDCRALVVTGTKGLQTQVLPDFESVGMVDIRGQANYRCLLLDNGLGCDDGPCHAGESCDLYDSGCLYYDAQARAAQAKLVVTNYAYWMSACRYPEPNADPIGTFDFIVLDEAHGARDWLTDFCSVELDRQKVRALLQMDMPHAEDSIGSVWQPWASRAADVARERYRVARQQSAGVQRTRALLELTRLGRSVADLSRELRVDSGNWVCERTKHGVKVIPVWPQRFAEQYLFRGARKVILSSAFMTVSACRYLGIDKAEIESHDVESTFDPKRRPLIYVPCVPRVRVDYKMGRGEQKILHNRIDAVIGDRLDRKGIVQCVSYDQMNAFADDSKHKGMLITHSSKETAEAVAEYKRAKAPCVLVSPAVSEGYDFIGPLARWQFIYKIPFIFGGDPLTKARTASDKSYKNDVAMQSLLQRVGRIMREVSDWGESIISDSHWQWFRRDVQAPKWFRASWRQETRLPKPPRLNW